MTRALAWALYPVLALAYVAVLFVADPGMRRFAILEAIYLAPIVVGVTLGAIAARRSSGAERRYWTLLSVANGLLGVCELMLLWWLAFVSPAGPPPVTWPFQVVHATAAGIFLVLVLSMTRLSSEGFARRLRGITDFAAIGLVMYAAILAFYARPVMTPAGAPPVAVLVGAGYVLAGCLMSVGTLANIVGFKAVKWRSWEALTAVAMSIYAIAIAMWPLWYTTVAGNSRNMERGLLDLIQFSGHFLLAVAAVYRLTEVDGWELRPLPSPAFTRWHWLSALATAGALGAVIALGVGALASHDDPVWFAVYGVLAVALVLLLLVRSVLLSAEHGRLFVQSVTDPLTGLFNHRYLHDQLAIEADRAVRYGEPFAVVVFDIDDFSRFNARYGHLEGDRLLAGVGARLGELVEGDDVAARLGGDEFAILLPGHDARTAAVFTQHVLDVLGVECGPAPGELSVSAGVAAYPEHAEDAEKLLHLADGALFQAKAAGKARVVVYDPARVPDLSASERIERLERQSRISAIRALAAAVDARDEGSRSHATQVADLATCLAEYLNLPAERVQLVQTAAMVHDVGKIAVADEALRVRAAADTDDPPQFRAHAEQGQRILAATGLPELVPAVRSHHEHWDGTGYPDGLAGIEIPYEARILALCNAYVSMICGRAGRPALSPSQARLAIIAEGGRRFDPRLAEDLVAMLETQEVADHGDVPCAHGGAKAGACAAVWTPVSGLEPEST